MICAIMQPTFLPWIGYFNLIHNVDKFVFLDDVQFEKQSWQSRNRILLNGSEYLLSIPIKKFEIGTRLNNIYISNNTNWRYKQWHSLNYAYKKCNFGNDALSILSPYYTKYDIKYLSEFNIKLIIQIAKVLKINVEFIKSSKLKCRGKRSTYIKNILDEINCDEYLSPIGSINYLKEDKFTSYKGRTIKFQNYIPKSYLQHNNKNFTSHLSIIDILSNIGIEKTKTHVKSNE